MYLSRLDIQGFKTFAQKTALVFPKPGINHRPMTVIVGPNGSGKSNAADAIRWCLGEQSLKHLRGKRAEDVIFSGSEGRGRSGFAEVALTFDNSDGGFPIEFSEVTITRRLYRDGESEYLLNGETTRLSDIQLLLAEAGVGQRSYAVIGQGMIDQIIVASPEERKTFFDDATGVRGFQMKRHQAILKLTRAAANLQEVEMLLGELEPRVNSLKRQVKRLEEREVIEASYRETASAYYATMWWNGEDEKRAAQAKVSAMKIEMDAAKKSVDEIDAKLSDLEAQQKAAGAADAAAMQEAHAQYKRALEAVHAARKRVNEAEREIELGRVRAQSSWAPLPLDEIISEVANLSKDHDELLDVLGRVKSLEELEQVVAHSKSLREKTKTLHKRLVRPAPEDWAPSEEQRRAIADTKTDLERAETAAKDAERAADVQAKASQTDNSAVFALQREVREKQAALMQLESRANTEEIAVARVETRLEALAHEIREALSDMVLRQITAQAPASRVQDLERAYSEVRRLKHQLEMIGGIDPEVVKEYAEVSERHNFLTTQVDDLRKAISSTRSIVAELDVEIKQTADKAFGQINEEFQKYFKVLFSGGSCALVRVKREEVADEPHRSDETNGTYAADEADDVGFAIPEQEWNGVEIQATPPGKTQKSLGLLSGGERALTSIALLCAVMATNPSPFVVLDEVDAALDEANTVRFANILSELRHRTQFLVITHNRATMEKADALYGVTMGDEGISQLLSVKLEDFAGGDSARR